MTMLSVVLPSRGEPYLKQTAKSLLDNASGDIEVVAVLDGYQEGIDDARIKLVQFSESVGMREAVSAGVKASSGKYVMKLDAHCMVAPGFDKALIDDYEEGCVVIPRELRLDPEKWEVIDDVRPPRDYWYFIYPRKFGMRSLHGYRWEARTEERMDIPVDDNLTFQGSCWFMSRDHFDKHNFLQDKGYQGLPQQEAEEIGLTTWMNGGRVLINKKTWYAHWHKGKSGRGYPLDQAMKDECYKYSYNKWVIENREGFTKLIKKFMPVPGWPEDWEQQLYED